MGSFMPGGSGLRGGAGTYILRRPPSTTVIRFSTGDDEIEADDWKAMGDKLKAPNAKKEGSETVHKLRVLNKLAADGWEFDSHPDINAWTLKRRLP
jgi:hypothetical protein